MTAPIAAHVPSRNTLWRLAVRCALLGNHDMAWCHEHYRTLLKLYGHEEERGDRA